ncbi:MAG: hypothetical protein RR161_03135 [Bacilli bacterium]
MINKLIINDLECIVTSATFNFINATNNGVKMYAANIKIEYLYDDNKGRFNYYVDNIISTDFNKLENLDFESNLSNDMPLLEMLYKDSFDTPYDGILKTSFGKVKDNKIGTTISIQGNDKYKIYFYGYLNLKKI